MMRLFWAAMLLVAGAFWAQHQRDHEPSPNNAHDAVRASAEDGRDKADPFDKSPLGSTNEEALTRQNAEKSIPTLTSSMYLPLRSYSSIALESTIETAARARLEKALESGADLDYLETPLRDVALDLARRQRIPIVLDQRALDDVGIGSDTPVSCSLRGMSLHAALKVMLKDFDLTYIIRAEALHITTPEAAANNLLTRFYRVSDLLPRTNSSGIVYEDSNRAEFLMELITTTVAPDSWDNVGGPGSIDFVSHLEVLVVSQTDNCFREIDNLLAIVNALTESRVQETHGSAIRSNDQMVLKIYKVFSPESVPSENNVDEDGEAEKRENEKRSSGFSASGLNREKMKSMQRRSQKASNPNELASFIPTVIGPESWNNHGGGSIKAFPEAIVVRQTIGAHEQIHQLLLDLDALMPRVNESTVYGYGGGGFNAPTDN